MRILLALTSTVIGIAALFYCLAEGRSLVDAIYFSVMTIATVGFGDLAPKTTLGKLFTVGYVVCGLPPHTTPGDGSDLLWAIVPALLGAAVVMLARWSQPRLAHALARLGNPLVQTLAGTALFALLAAAVPLVRFSGHHELVHALEHGVTAGAAALLGLALLKALAMALCLASGWRGGENGLPGLPAPSRWWPA